MTTPMMQQHREAKERHPGMILLFRAGDFYELFFEDAEIASRILGIALTTRDGHIPMAGFPHHALENHLRKFIKAGHRVAICDQVEDASQAKGRLIRREVTRVITPGTLTDEGLLDPRRANHLVALAPRTGGTAPSASRGSTCPPACSTRPTCRATGSSTRSRGWPPRKSSSARWPPTPSAAGSSNACASRCPA